MVRVLSVSVRVLGDGPAICPARRASSLASEDALDRNGDVAAVDLANDGLPKPLFCSAGTNFVVSRGCERELSGEAGVSSVRFGYARFHRE